MSLATLFARYQAHPEIIAFANSMADQTSRKGRVKGLHGSQPAFVLGAIAEGLSRTSLFIVEGREEALYLLNDLEQVVPGRQHLLFPSSSKRAYQLDTVENANLLERSEVLNALNHTHAGELVIVTYPEALAEKVINRQSLVQHTLEIKTGERPGMEFLVEMLEEYGFESTDFVYEPGQYARRGGIVDLFSFGAELPFRIEFDGEAIESIRSFEPATQLSIQKLAEVAIIPNIRTTLKTEQRISLLEYLSPNTLIFLKDVRFTLDELSKVLEKAEMAYHILKSEGGDMTKASTAEQLYVSAKQFGAELKGFTAVEFGTSNYFRGEEVQELQWGGKAQPLFKKEFNLLAEHLLANQTAGLENYICCENEKQVRRLTEIFQQLNPEIKFTALAESIAAGFLDKQLGLALYTDHQIFERYHRFRHRAAFTRSQALTLKELLELQPGDFVTHVQHGVGRFAGLEKIKVGEHEQEAIRLIYQDNDMIFVNVNALYKISKYSGKEGTAPRLNKLGSPEWERTTAKVKKRVKELAFDLVALYARRKAQVGFAYSADSYMQQELEASFMYEDTPDQGKATDDVKADLEAPHPMDRLVCGDVGFGKTEIAVRAAFKAATDGKQVAVLVPTTILAMQHAKTFSERLGVFPVTIDYINRFKSAKEQKETLQRLADGKIDILIGTHRILSKDVLFKELGLLIIDEEHKFGVGAKEKLRLLKANVDTLTLTATPIPRTLQFSLLGIRDLSLINTPPPNRKPVETILGRFDAEVIRDAVAYELKRRGQVFFVHNRIKDLEEIAGMIKKLVPDARIGIAHGQLEGDKIEEIMLKFVAAEYDVLVCTTIIESGLDISNANTIIINEAHTYGLSDLHQMRGRVGRSNRKAFCHLLSPPISVLPTDARKRLQALEEFTDLGSGIQIAMRDLDIRGAGDILGSEQSGFIAEIGYDFYHKILDESIRELKAEHFPELLTEEQKNETGDCQVDTDQEVLIPESYIPNVAERLSFYKRISAAEENELLDISRELIDRFGLIPMQTFALFDTMRIRMLGKHLGFERIVLKNGSLKAYFPQNPGEHFLSSGAFNPIIAYVQQHPQSLSLRQVQENLVLQAHKIPTIKEAYMLLRDMEAATKRVAELVGAG